MSPERHSPGLSEEGRDKGNREKSEERRNRASKTVRDAYDRKSRLHPDLYPPRGQGKGKKEKQDYPYEEKYIRGGEVRKRTITKPRGGGARRQ